MSVTKRIVIKDVSSQYATTLMVALENRAMKLVNIDDESPDQKFYIQDVVVHNYTSGYLDSNNLVTVEIILGEEY